MTGIGLGFLAGLLSTLSPCVLPLIPLVIGAALGQHRFGPAALVLGLAFSFVTVGLFVATIGFAAGLDQEIFRAAGGVLLIVTGAVLALPRLQLQLATAAGPFGTWAHEQSAGLSHRGLGGQFLVGVLLGAVWTPCVGPTLGAASVLAARAESLPFVALTMLAFGIGAALPLLAIGMMSREALTRWRSRMLSAGANGKILMAAVLVLVGVLVLTGVDKTIEAALVAASPDWLTNLTTRI